MTSQINTMECGVCRTQAQMTGNSQQAELWCEKCKEYRLHRYVHEGTIEEWATVQRVYSDPAQTAEAASLSEADTFESDERQRLASFTLEQQETVFRLASLVTGRSYTLPIDTTTVTVPDGTTVTTPNSPAVVAFPLADGEVPKTGLVGDGPVGDGFGDGPVGDGFGDGPVGDGFGDGPLGDGSTPAMLEERPVMPSEPPFIAEPGTDSAVPPFDNPAPFSEPIV